MRGTAAGLQVREAQVDKAGEAWREKGDRCGAEGRGIKKLASDFTSKMMKKKLSSENSLMYPRLSYWPFCMFK